MVPAYLLLVHIFVPTRNFFSPTQLAAEGLEIFGKSCTCSGDDTSLPKLSNKKFRTNRIASGRGTYSDKYRKRVSMILMLWCSSSAEPTIFELEVVGLIVS